MRRLFFLLATFYLVLIPLLIPVYALAAEELPCKKDGNCRIGTQCDDDDQCASKECENSTKRTKNGAPIAFCVCSEIDTRNIPLMEVSSQTCFDEYKIGSAQDWVCSDDSGASLGLNFCINTRQNINKLPIDGGTATLLDAALDPGLVADEIAAQIREPQPRITIPGLDFTDPNVVKSYTRVESDGRTYLFIPYLGEYISALYKYAIISAGAIAVVYIIAHGFKIIISAGASEAISESKKRISQVIIGLLLALGSYVILYTINPNLVKLKSLKVLYIPQEDVALEEEDSTSYEQFTPQNVGTPSWKEGEFTCARKEQYPPMGVVSTKGLITYECPVGVIGTVTTIPEMKEPLCKVGAILAAQGYGVIITSSYRPFEKQVQLWCDDTSKNGAAKKYPDPMVRKKWVATPGYSNHGHGIAVDAHLTKDRTQVWSGTPEGQCHADPAQVKILADAFYAADQKFNRYSNEIWHFEFGSGQKSTMGKFTEIMAKRCQSKL